MVVVRLAKSGAKKKPYYFITVADSRKPRDGSYIERLGFFNPSAKGSEERLRFNIERFDYWVEQGAQVSDRVKELEKDARMSPEELQAKLDLKKDKREKKKELLAAKKADELAAQAEEKALEDKEVPETEAEPEVAAEAEPEPEVAAEAEPEAEVEPEAESEPEPEPEVAAEAVEVEIESSKDNSEEEPSEDEKQ